ncbi:glycosyltransferase [Variovorax sp. HJSM1_2]|uniref:glycosyltransferase n=1 Tax=Variovorax sp. HJSM1_2 TaxID=3366263 RepID=UPI003BBDA7EA
MKVSVIVPTFNRANYIAECLDSLLTQSMPAHEIIVVDDGSEDGTSELLEAYGTRIRYVRKENGGKPSAVNLGLSLAEGDLIWIFDDDDVALADAIETRVAVLSLHPEAGFVYSPHFYGSDGPGGRIARGRPHVLPQIAHEQLLSVLMEGCFFHLATALVRASAYRTLGGFDTNLLSSEDYDMQLRLARHFRGVVSTAPCFVFRQHTGLRGAKAIRYAGADRGKVFRRFDQRVGHKLRAELPLGDYLVPRQADGLSAQQQRQALLARAVVMGSKGCIPELLQDAATALSHHVEGHSLSHSEYEQLARAIRTGYAYDALGDQGWGGAGWEAPLLAQPGGRKAILALADGIWRMARGYPGSARERWQKLRSAAMTALVALK